MYTAWILVVVAIASLQATLLGSLVRKKLDAIDGVIHQRCFPWKDLVQDHVDKDTDYEAIQPIK